LLVIGEEENQGKKEKTESKVGTEHTVEPHCYCCSGLWCGLDPLSYHFSEGSIKHYLIMMFKYQQILYLLDEQKHYLHCKNTAQLQSYRP
jgi:hypothetical protein